MGGKKSVFSLSWPPEKGILSIVARKGKPVMGSKLKGSDVAEKKKKGDHDGFVADLQRI